MKIDELAKETIEKILQKYHNRADWDKRSLSRMIEQELKNYNEEVRKLIEEEIYKILGELYTPFSENKELAISPVVLSELLYKNAKNLSKEVTKILYESIKAKETTGVIAKKLYEGYGFKDKEVLEVIDRDLPKYIKDALKKGDTKKVMRQIEKLRTKPLRIAYKEIFRKLDEMNAKALEKAMKSAYHEKMRYYAKRIADTETHRALMSRRAYEYLNDENVEFVKFTMSSAHPKVDICDFYANLDVGYGRGVVPKKEMRTLPIHPHCHCIYAPYYRKVKGKRKPWEQAVKDTMSKFSEYEQKEILATRAMLERFKAGEDIEEIFNVLRPKYPIKKYVDLFNRIDYNFEKREVLEIEDKILKRVELVKDVKKDFHKLWMSKNSFEKHVKKRLELSHIKDKDDYILKTINCIIEADEYILAIHQNSWNNLCYNKKDNWVVIFNENGEIMTSYKVEKNKKSFEELHKEVGGKIQKGAVNEQIKRAFKKLRDRYKKLGE